MTTYAEFPGNILTNSYILQDFTEIAYIVCTGAIPASANNASTTVDINSPVQILTRLRNAEKQYRQASILVSLDAENLEVYTFYKKIDVVKDQKTILNKFGSVSRLNGCIISYKNAAHVLELLKPANARVFRLFTSAVLSSIRISPAGDEPAISVAPSLYLLPSVDGGRPQNLFGNSRMNWSLHKVDLQVVTGGQLVLSVCKADTEPFISLKDCFQDNSLGYDQVSEETTLYLVPGGQLARYKQGWRGSSNSFEHLLQYLKDPSHNSDKHRQRWMVLAREWIRRNDQQDNMSVADDDDWVEVELPVLGKDSGDGRKLEWKSIVWPLKLIYILRVPQLAQRLLATSSDKVGADPASFCQDWFIGAEERNNIMLMSPEGMKGEQEDEGRLFDDEMQFDMPEPAAPFGPPTFPSNHMVYPTPPDVGIAHPTPGMLSVDGFAPTPATAPPMSQEVPLEFSDDGPSDTNIANQDAKITSDFFVEGNANDDDLFEEFASDKLGDRDVSEEPDWDCFDDQDFNPGSESLEKQRKDDLASGATEIILPTTPRENPEELSTSPMILVHQSPILGAAMSDKNKADHTNETIEPGANFMTSPQQLTEPSAETPRNSAVKGAISTTERDEKNHTSHYKRRSSIYDAVPTPTLQANNKYEVNGRYWFPAYNNPSTDPRTSHGPPHPSVHRSSYDSLSSESTSDTAMSEDEEDKGSFRSNTRKWTEYDLNSPLQKQENAGEPQGEDIETNVMELIAVLDKAVGEEPFLYPLHRKCDHEKEELQTSSRSLMVAQLLVEQFSQTSFMTLLKCLPSQRADRPSDFELSVYNSGSNSLVEKASLADLSSMQTSNTQHNFGARISLLEPSKILVSRGDETIKVSTSILRFWDTVNLRPVNGRKDLTAFCLHPVGDAFSESCSFLMDHLATMFSTGNFGTHSTGRVTGITNTGLITWDPKGIQRKGLRQVCQNLGTALATSPTFENTILIYMVIPDSRIESCPDLCEAFILLFESFAKARLSKTVDIALQLLPASLLVSADTIMVPSQDQYCNLAMEVYNRLPPPFPNEVVGQSGSAVTLAKGSSSNPYFELNATMRSATSKDGDCIHVGYCYSLDKRWIVATWTDESGTISLSMTYCLKSSPQRKGRPRIEIFKDICEVSQQLMIGQRRKWWLAIARVDYFEKEELQEWLFLASQSSESSKALGKLALVSVQLQPKISLQIPVSQQKHSQPTAQQPTLPLNTPVSTPQATTTSPEQNFPSTPAYSAATSANAPTPPEQGVDNFGEMDVSLHDPMDDCWMVNLAFGLNQSYNFLEIRPALASGLLVKRAISSTGDSSGIASMGVSLVAMPQAQQLSRSEREQILQDIANQYRGLVVLAVTRGVIDNRKECIPWHVATSYKGAMAVGELL